MEATSLVYFHHVLEQLDSFFNRIHAGEEVVNIMVVDDDVHCYWELMPKLLGIVIFHELGTKWGTCGTKRHHGHDVLFGLFLPIRTSP